ncbi:hypothetical protein D9Q98_005363 [Chlorella vulgaris]|uniref:Chloride channel protein n=1 Tax=Chlorella vulgaris TaxID=3077 RepID=A0A9D4TLN5_CHLVU|nr:hypothetical protein D9Q98_005363 [Chlorella vulgaris]
MDEAPQQQKDEPELALIVVACGIGLATGAAIVAFNIGVHWIRDLVWQDQELLTSNKLRDITETDLWPKIVFAPLLGGLAVGSLGWLIGGYDDTVKPKLTPSTDLQQRLQRGLCEAGNDGLASADELGSKPAATAATSSSSSSSSSGPAAAAGEQWKAAAGAVVRPVARALAAVVTLGSGASLGPEGPSVDIGKSVAQGLGSSLRSRQRHLTSLIAAGSGAGVAAGFNAPISGVFFAVETVLQRQKLPRGGSGSELTPQAAVAAQQEQQRSGLTVAMVLLASVLAAVVSQAGLGSSPAFTVPEYRLESLYELPLYLLFGAICGIVSASCSFSTRVATEAFDELREQNKFEAALTPAMGGLTTGMLALGYPEILYQGFDNVNNILSSNGAYAPGLLIQIVVMKVIATAICRGSGLQGGLYAPSIFIGAALGTAFGLIVNALGDPLGLTIAAPQAYALVGVAALLASNCQVPLTSVLLLFELTRDYLIILPTLAAVGISFWVSSLVAPSVKNAAASRRMNAAAAASAAISTTRLDRAATEAALIGSLQGKLAVTPAPGAAASTAAATAGAAAAAAAAGTVLVLPEGGTSAAAAAVAGGTDKQVGAAELAAAAARSGRKLPVGDALERSCLLVEAEMPVGRALALMEADDQHVAVVLDSDGGVLGLVTREILEQCVTAAEDALNSESAGTGSGSSSRSGSGGSRGSLDSGEDAEVFRELQSGGRGGSRRRGSRKTRGEE